MTDPLPCPICGCSQIIAWHIGHYSQPWIVECPRCLAGGPHAETEVEAIDRWNVGAKK